MQFAVTSWKTKKANEFQMWRELLICTFMQNQTHLGQILFTLVSKNKIVPVIQQVQRQSLQMGQLLISEKRVRDFLLEKEIMS